MLRVAAVLAAVLAALLTTTPPATATVDFPGLLSGERVDDRTGSLSREQAGDLERRLDTLRRSAGLDAVVVVRDEEADARRTSVQVQQLRTSWAEVEGVDEDDVAAILVNRQPGADDEARVGVDIGSRFKGADAVPLRERQAIISEDLVPALRDGDVAGALDAAVGRLERDLDDGPPPAPGVRGLVEGSPALQWGYAAVVVAGCLAAGLVWLGRPRPTTAPMAPTTLRPDATTPAWLGAALARNTLSVGLLPVALLTLARRGALVLAAESTGLWRRRPALCLRQLDDSVERDPVEDAVWAELVERARSGTVAEYSVSSLATDKKLGREALEDTLRQRGWFAEGRPRAGRQLRAIAIGAGVMVALRFAATDEDTVVGAFALVSAVLAFAALALSSFYPSLSSSGLDARRPWQAYRKGLEKAVRDEDAAGHLDLDVVLPDLVALGQRAAVPPPLADAMGDADVVALRTLTTDPEVAQHGGAWAVFIKPFVGSSSDSTSGGSDGGGGGDAGGT